MSRRTKLSGIFQQSFDELAAANLEEEAVTRNPAGPVKSMALSMSHLEQEAIALREAIKSGLQVHDLDPNLVEPSFVRDRIEQIHFEADDPFLLSIRENGQEVPILVRPHPEKSGAFQVAYGHRRLEAAKVLGIKVKAVIKEIDDSALVIAQGVENGERRNLSYIERVLFAQSLEARGFSRPVIMKALSTDKTELSKMLSVSSRLPEELVRKIGSAPNVGRRRWISLAEIATDSSIQKMKSLLDEQAARKLTSDQRFELAIKSLQSSIREDATTSKWSPKDGGNVSATFKASQKSFVLSLGSNEAKDFGLFLADRLDALYRDYRSNKGD